MKCLTALLFAQDTLHGSGYGFEDSGSGLIEPSYPCAAWGDYDSDGDLDLLVAGRAGFPGTVSTVLYANTGGTYADSGISLPGLEYASAAWGDFDQDGKLDLAMIGQTHAGVATTRVYRNNGTTFDLASGSFTGVMQGALAWGDYDNDNDLDLVVTGITMGPVPQASTTLYRNDGGVFSAVSEDFPDVYLSAVAWADYDRDGDLDLVIAGAASDGSLNTELFRNNGGTFVDANAGLPGIQVGFAAWGDYDNDGDLDLLLGGGASIAGGKITRLYRNDGGVLTNAGAVLPALLFSSAAWGDYDSDSDLDFILIGHDGSGQVSKLYRNDGGTFVDDPSPGLPGLFIGMAAWGNYDNDGDLDLLLGGLESSSENILRIYRNNLDPAENVSVGRQAAGDIHVVWRGTPGSVYEVRCSSNLASDPSTWSLLDTLTAGPDGLLDVNDPQGSEPARFYRAIRP